eukprot:TRINITY_DN91627_c0_g1_i1.p1 TRINITY_DN91627_c0_g1~~TRINITY_DN91627_c0_g1_i1.p1  ORF type:complete len:225 (-),score=25.18 TRINITY_DN91627_c0_g1_i1:135-809(-)
MAPETHRLTDNLVEYGSTESVTIFDTNGNNEGLGLVCLTYFGNGILIMINYVWGCLHLQKYATDERPIGAAVLWGHLRDPGNGWLLHIYFFGFFAATLGYFLNLSYILRVANFLYREDGGTLLRTLCLVYTFFFITEYFWLPLCAMYLAHPSTLLYFVIRLQLFLSGVSGLAWAGLVYQSTHLVGKAVGSVAKSIGVLGAGLFALHCFCLDCCIWPPYFRDFRP